MAFFLRFQESEAGWHVALGIQGATRCVIGETSLCQGDSCGVEVIGGYSKGRFGVSGSDEVGLRVQPHLIRAAEWCVFQGKER